MLRYYSELERLPTDRIVLSWDIALSEQEKPAITLRKDRGRQRV